MRQDRENGEKIFQNQEKAFPEASMTNVKVLAKEVRILSRYRERMNHQGYGGISTPYDAIYDWQKRDPRSLCSLDYKFHCTLDYKRRRYSFDFFTASITNEPTAEETLDWLLYCASLAEQTFEEFCFKCGYDTDNRRAEQVWNEYQKIAENLKRLFGKDYESLREGTKS